MKKFLSLALAMIMTLSLVTISAGATEYKDLTDKDEIQYEEAVAVLNRLGIITGYSEGDFRPQGELTRGAAAKIIVSLLIGADAAEALPKDSSPYPDVPAGSTFAGVISYCKNMKIIDGYTDGTFRSTGTLTGYAFSKMLLGILGYDGAQEHFTGAGWTTNVANLAHAANLFDRINFSGGETVNRETACQLALNTLKATEVEYTGGMDITVGDAQINAPKTRTYKTSNQEWASHISSRRAGYNMGGNSQTSNNIDNHYTVEFGEEHFKDLRMDHDRDTHDQFGRPANEWSYKKVTIGTFALEPDYVYTTQVAHNVATTTSAAKVRALDLNGYDLEADDVTSTGNQKYTNLWLNGKQFSEGDGLNTETATGDNYLTKVADIADYTDNGTLVEVYVDDADADFIRDVVVIKTQLMEVRSQKSESVALKLYDDESDAEGKVIYGYNQKPIDKAVNDVEVDDDLYASLKDKKVGDIVAVVPVYVDSDTKYDVAEAYTPETVSGTLTRVDTYGNVTAGIGDNYKENDGRGVISATVGGTDYKVALWNKNLYDIDGTSIRVTRKDVTLYMDVYGNAMLATDVGATSNFMVVAGYHSGLVNGRVVTYVDGYDINGNEISLNIGNHNYAEGEVNNLYPRGNLVHYKSNTTSNYAEWDLDYLGVYDVASERRTSDTQTEPYSLRASNGRVLLNGWDLDQSNNGTPYTTDSLYKGNDNQTNNTWSNKISDASKTTNIATDDAGIKFIYVTIGDDDEVDSVEIKNGMQATTHEEILGEGSGFAHKRAQACVSLKSNDTQVNGESVIKAIVIKRDSSSANLSNLVYIHNYTGSAGRSTDNQGRIVYGYEVKFIGATDWDDTKTIYSYKNLKIGEFARARKAVEAPTEVQGVTEDNFYTLNGYGERTGVALSVSQTGEIEKILSNNKTLLEMKKYYNPSNDPAEISTTWPIDRDLDVGDEGAESIVSIAHAKIIDLTGNDVDNATDLKDLWNNITDRQKEENKDNKRVIEIAMLYNDKHDDDEFRDVYVLVIRRADPSKVYVPSTTPVTPTGSVVPSVDGAFAALTGVKVGDTVTITLNAGYEFDTANQGASATATATAGQYVINSLPATIAVKATVAPADTHKVTVTVNGTEDATLSKADVKNGEAYEFTYTVPAGYTATVKIGDGNAVAVPADGKITVPAGSADVTVAIVTTAIPAGFQAVIANSAKGDATAAAIKVEKKDDNTITISGMPADNEIYRVNVVLNGVSQATSMENGDLAYTEGAVVYIQKATQELGIDNGALTVIISWDDAGDFGSLASLQNAGTNWTSTGVFKLMTLKGEDYLMEVVTAPKDNGKLKTGYKPQPTKLQKVLDLFKDPSAKVTIEKMVDATIGFTTSTVEGSGDWVEVNFPLTAGKPAFPLNEAMDIDIMKNGKLSVQPHSNAYVVTVNGTKVTTWTAVDSTDVVNVEKAKPAEIDTVRAVLSATGVYDLYVYGAQRVLTDDEVIQAVETARGETVKTYKNGKGTFEDNHPFTINTTVGKSQLAPGPLYKINILGKVSYMYPTESIQFPTGVSALIRANDGDKKFGKIATTGSTANKSTGTLIISTDAKVPAFSGSDERTTAEQVYVEAVLLDKTKFKTLTDDYKVYYESVENEIAAPTMSGPTIAEDTYVMKDLPVVIQLKTANIAKANLTVNFMVDGEVVNSKTYNNSGMVASDEIILGTPKKATGLEIDVKDGYSVVFDGQSLGVFSVGDKVPLDDYIQYPDAYIFLVDTNGEAIEGEKSTVDPYLGKIYTVAAADKKVGGKIVLGSYVQVAVDDSDNFIVYTDESCRVPLEAINGTTAKYNYVPAGTEIYFKASEKPSSGAERAVTNAVLEAAANANYVVPDLEVVEPASFHTQGIWKLEPVRNVLKTDYVIGFRLPGEAWTEDSSNAWTIDVTNLSPNTISAGTGSTKRIIGVNGSDVMSAEWIEKDMPLELSGSSLIYGQSSNVCRVTLNEPTLTQTGAIDVSVTAAGPNSGAAVKPATTITGKVRVNVDHGGETYFFEINVTISA